MARTGLQKEVIELYRQGVRNAMSKAPDQRQAFLIHLRYNFHHPPLTSRDFTAVEFQIRKFRRTLEMLSQPSTQRIGLSQDMRDWWANEVERAHARATITEMKKAKAASS
ncbi:hypothetical protein CcaverHIS002_0409840 [Cutaneotrichosporon cavernicola]|uniref:Succinate dehydrogenase assembly factor 1, mitochondrial n=1 Tax=Cutaneotrichosporon cavernicola TaxID=279322 RepID=A0AA48L558_9TREE|nr:uncharacterized protein CcaverHIS019_0409760 [Cutaneotrichosporon cavernicola]BEI84380.1 hypothetical protein CcaverHIS002_0409840 [Cutaneotrichosporon cavernicola]BEI92156.1 hypothetical protein CcaverHIS019_0409760 [Cutaneotrichosporon cavernicola]BEI99926.1 hypothetical protein CcaverHIS631_0409690 [Cutaneotrichosporon cavernicola]BEJ07701.1 hypothetical protein CcaverHIS641_0409700 [Cutaneotrichosporon cavernicola]